MEVNGKTRYVLIQTAHNAIYFLSRTIKEREVKGKIIIRRKRGRNTAL